MADNITAMPSCPFRNPIMNRDYACEQAKSITRRDGPDIGCQDARLNERCCALFVRIKTAVLPAFEIEDESLMPASVISKIQYGGLRALADSLPLDTDVSINLAETVRVCFSHFKELDAIPFSQFIPVVRDYPLKRRRKQKT